MEDKSLYVSICYQLRLTVDSVALSFLKSLKYELAQKQNKIMAYSKPDYLKNQFYSQRFIWQVCWGRYIRLKKIKVDVWDVSFQVKSERIAI